MKASFIGDDLFKGFNLVASVVPSSAIKQILGGVKIGIVNGIASLMATDLEILVRCEINTTSCEGEGGIVLPATRVNNILREWASSSEIFIEIGEGSCLLKSGGGYFKIMGEDVNRFPEIGPTETGVFVEVEGNIISNMISKVIHAVSMVKIKSVLSGILMIVEGDTIVMVAADGNRLSVIKRKVVNTSGISVRGIIPVRCLMLLQRFVSDWDGVLKIGMSESRVQFVGGKVEIVSQLIDGQYPNYEDIIPKKNDKKIEIKKDDVVSALRMASFMTDEGYRVVECVFDKNKLKLSSRAMAVGETELEVNINYEGPTFKLNVNPDYILDVLKSSDEDVIPMEFGDNESAILFRAGHEHVSVVMPMETEDAAQG